MSAAQDRYNAASEALTAFDQNDAAAFAAVEAEFLGRKRAVRDEFVSAEREMLDEVEAARVAALDPTAPVAEPQVIQPNVGGSDVGAVVEAAPGPDPGTAGTEGEVSP